MSFRERPQRFQTEKLPIAVREAGTFVWSRGVLLNLSTTGAQIYTQAKFASGSDVEIEFTTVGASGKRTKNRMIAKVVWFSGARYGVQFKKKIKRS